MPAAAARLPCVIFVHGLGSSKASPRNVTIAAHLLDVGIAALLFDLSGHGQSSTDPRGEEAYVDDLEAVSRWACSHAQLDPERLGVAGSSLGAVVAMAAARRSSIQPASMVLRAPPAHAEDWEGLKVPALVLVGSRDPLLPEVSAGATSCPSATLAVVQGASHLFEEPGTLDEALTRTVEWFRAWLVLGDPPAAEAPIRTVRATGNYGPLFRDRRDAGRRLGERLAKDLPGQDVLVLGIPRGGVPVADEVARRLDAELDVIVARKLGAPGYPELAIGAVTANGGRFLNQDVLRELSVSNEYLESVTDEERAEARRREERFRAGRSRGHYSGRTVIIVDDGLATGATMRAAVRSVRLGDPARLLVAVPVGSRQACAALRDEADDVVCPFEPEPFRAVGFYYEQFGQTEDSEVQAILADAHAQRQVLAG
jgi:predicted phosphoribosyltransferase/dienelactone hydrolase